MARMGRGGGVSSAHSAPSDTTTPLVGNTNGRVGDGNSGVGGAGRFLRHVSRRRINMPVVRETAGTESTQGDQTSFVLICVVIVGILWNLAFVAVAVTILVLSRDENPSEPLRAWIIGYAVKCVVDMLLLACTHCQSILTELLDSANTVFAFIWWIIGICWICAGGQTLIEDAPQLYWLSVAFIACDVITIVFRCVSAVAVTLGICLCLRPIMSILFPVGDIPQVASQEDNATV